MKLLALLLLFQQLNPLTISRQNALKEEAKEAFLEEKYEQAAELYAQLEEKLPEEDGAVSLNRAHALYLAGKTGKADTLYRQLAARQPNGHLRSVAWQQLGFMAQQQQQFENAISYFKQALIAEPNNPQALFNYELALKKQAARREQEQQQQQQQQGDQQQEQQQPPPEPSAWAEALKEKADRLAANRQYSEAFSLMQDGLKQDPTVAAYSDFINKLQLIADIHGR